MPAFNLGYLLKAANTGLTSARQGAREREAVDYERQQDESARMFNEWAKRNALEYQQRQGDALNEYRTGALDLRRDLGEMADATKRELAASADDTKRWVQGELTKRFNNAGGTPFQDEFGNFKLPKRNWSEGPVVKDMGVRAPLPESRDGVSTAGGQNKPRQMPVGEIEKITGVNSVRQLARDAHTRLQSLMSKGTNVSGPITGRTSRVTSAMGLDPVEKVRLQQTIANLGSEETLRRSGAAVTDAEFERLRPFIPSRNDDEKTLLWKLAGFDRELGVIQANRLDALQDFGFDVSQHRARLGTGPTQPPAADPATKARDILDSFRKPPE